MTIDSEVTVHGFATRAIHVGSEPDPSTGAVIPPIYQTSTFAQDGVGGLRTGLGTGYEYSRSGNPTRTALERALAALEAPPVADADGTANQSAATQVAGKAVRAFAFASGLAAEDTLLRAVLQPGDHLVLGNDAYGGTYRLIARVAGPWGVAHNTVDVHELDTVRAAIRPGRTRLVWIETPTNPLLTVADIAALAEIAHAAGALLVVDNTFATPYLQQPLALGADVVAHSTTKYIGGHSDVVGGALIAADVELPHLDGVGAVSGNLHERLAFHHNAMGAVNGPFDAWLTHRGLKTLAVRMDRHCSNATAVVEFLSSHPAITQVLYPGLPEHPGHTVATRQMRGYGGMISIRLGSRTAALRLCERTQLFTLAESLGGVESLIEHPSAMTHASVAGSTLEVPDDLVRLSVGIEQATDLIADLDQALR